MFLDITEDGVVDDRDMFEWANPNPFQRLFSTETRCSGNPDCA
jgi:hypothetical protein